MPVQQILAGVLPEISKDPGGIRKQEGVGTNATDVITESLVLALERECNSRYKDTGDGLHFVGLLLAVFVAEVLSAYCERNAQIGNVKHGRRTARMVSCLYSKDRMALVLSHPSENQAELKNKLAQIWGHNSQQGSRLSGGNEIYTVSAAVRISNSLPAGTQQNMPFFGCPRKYSETLTNEYVPERFEEADLLPVFAVAIAASSAEEAIKVIFESHRPQNPSLSRHSEDAFNENEFPMLQFARGLGGSANWITDPALLRNAKLKLDSQQSLVSSKIIGLFGSLIHPNILFYQDDNVGVYSSSSKEYSILSHNNDFFAAGMVYSTYSKTSPPLTSEPGEELPAAIKAESMLEKSNSFINLPSSVSLFPGTDPTQVLKSQKQYPESPSFFSPSFAEQLPSSNRYDPRIHTFPLHLSTPTRSQSFPVTQSPVRTNQAAPFHFKGRSATPVGCMRRTSEVPSSNITPISPQELANLLSSRSMLLVDIRAFAAYAKSRLVDAINICIPTVLLKRPSLSLDDISESISRGDRGRFAKWKEAGGIVIYDADSLRVKDSYPVTTLAMKFLEAGFERTTYGLSGGFAALVEVPSLIDTSPLTNIKSPSSSPSTPKFLPSTLVTKPPAVDAATRLALGCKEFPLFTRNSTTQAPGAPAFFSSIRQNMDLHGGVGPLIPINAPSIPPSLQCRLPKWLTEVAYSPSGAQILAKRWETIELAEKQRLESVLMRDGMSGRFSISAAMERGEKNRYPNIWPFEWNRVKIPQAVTGQDYFNGSYIQDGQGNRRYIATQAPVPGTLEDFWKVIWGEGVQMIVCLTAMEEGGQIKCHPYWRQCTIGEMEVMPVNETTVSLGAGQTAVMRTLILQNRAEPFTSIREIIQIHYEGWPDFGTPAEATTIVSLVRLLNDVTSSLGKSNDAPVVVHCSAGCGRSGTFCIVDSVINSMDSADGDEDLIYQGVLRIREQRMSLVQTLRQYVLCYECVLHHILSKMRQEDNQMEVE